jgi:hypothetical protein
MDRLQRGIAVYAASALLVPLLLLVGSAAASATTGAGAPVRVSRLPGQNAEVEQAVDGRYVYEVWMAHGRGIGFARSVDGGRTFGRSRIVPGSRSAGRPYAWDPAVAVARDGTLYLSYMRHLIVGSGSSVGQEMVPVVDASHDHGRSFPQVKRLPVPVPATKRGNFGDRDFVAVGPDGTVYVTWDYGPRAEDVEIQCLKAGSCVFSGGDFNGVIQKSSDEGKTWSSPAPISPGFPAGGVFSAPIVAQPNGTLDVLYWQHPTNPKTLTVSPGQEYFTRSTNGGKSWSSPVPVGQRAGTIRLNTWWIDGSLAVDPAGNLYASWDTQRGSRDTGWLAWSTDGGRVWSAPLPVASSRSEHLVEVAAAGRGDVYVGWQTRQAKGYATFLRRRSLDDGWTGPTRKVSSRHGKAKIWPGDTFGLSRRGGSAIVSWGSAITGRRTSEIYAATLVLPTR